MESRRDVREKSFKPFLEAQKSIGPEGLDEALCRGCPESVLEGGPIKIPFRQPVIKGQEFITVTSGKIHIGIAEKRAKIVEGVSEAHPLKVDEKGFPVTDHHVLGLQITVNERAHRSRKPLCQAGKFRLEFPLEGRLKFDPADIPDEMIPEVLSLPAIEIRTKALHEIHTCRREVLFGEAVKSAHDGKRLLVKDSSSFPGGFPERPEVRIPEVFHDDETAGRIVANHPGRRNIDVMEKCRNVGIVCVLYTVWVIMDQDGRVLAAPFQSGESPVRPSPLDGKKFYGDGH